MDADIGGDTHGVFHAQLEFLGEAREEKLGLKLRHGRAQALPGAAPKGEHLGGTRLESAVLVFEPAFWVPRIGGESNLWEKAMHPFGSDLQRQP